MNHQFICDECGSAVSEDDAMTMYDVTFCPDCSERQTVVCRDCGSRIWRSDAVDDNLCQRCYEYNYTECSECGRVIRYDNAYYTDDDEDTHDYPYCESCYYERREKFIHDYYYKPDPIFYGSELKDSIYLGVELEIDDGYENESNAEEILNTANAVSEHIYIKHDGSLDSGFEIVSHPMSLAYQREQMPWREVLKKCINLGYSSHQSETCGLHIHVNREAFGNTDYEQENAIARLIYFYEKFWTEILRFSRRTEEQVNRWASRYGCAISTCKNSLDTAKKKGLRRYTAVNLTNKNTIEFRIFRGSLRYETFIATIEFTYYLCGLAKKLSDEYFHSMSWLDFVSGIDAKEYPELISYLKIRRLYINEPVKETEEI